MPARAAIASLGHRDRVRPRRCRGAQSQWRKAADQAAEFAGVLYEAETDVLACTAQ